MTTVAGWFVAAPSAHADEVYPRPANGQMQLQGHGFGHGIGMSSYGSYGAAIQGVTWPAILSHYYPGATRSAFGNPSIRIDVRGDLGSQMAFAPAGGLWASFGPNHTGGYPLGTSGADGTSVVVFQAVTAGSGMVQLAYLTQAGHWYSWGPASTQLNITNPSSGRVTAWGAGGGVASYPGEFRAVPVSGAIVPVAVVPMEEYVRGVVSHEAIPSWPAAALAAQAVASRTFGAYALAHPRASAYDICDTTSCQVYKASGFYASTDSATSSTAGVVLTYAGSPIVAYFSASSGGYNAGGGAAYLPAQPDPWDGVSANPYRTWTASVTAAAIESAWPSIGRFTQLRVLARDGAGDWGGRVTSMAFDGASGSVTVSGDTVRGRFGLRSTYFTPLSSSTTPGFPRDYTGDGRADLMWINPAVNGGQLWRATGLGPGAFDWSQPWANVGSVAAVFSPGTWDADRIADVMTVDASGRVVLWPGATPGQNSRQVGSGVVGYDSFFPMGDFNGDGRADVFARRGSDATLWMFSAAADGTLTGPTQVAPSMGQVRTFFSPGDFDGDGRVDMVTVDAGGQMTLFSAVGDGRWLRNLHIGTEWSGTTSWFSVGDTSGDGRSDINFTTNDGTLWRLTGTGSASFASADVLGRNWPTSVRFLK